MIFDRVKPLDAILATAEKKSLHRSLGAFQLTMLGIGAIIGTGIFVLTAEAAQKAGPGMMLSFVIAGFVCAVAALCYSELASMVPVSGSAYTYTYAVMGEMLAWMVGWALVLEYAVAAGAVSVGWSGYFVGLFEKYLYDPNSPMRNEELYIPALEAMIASERLGEADKVRARYRLELARRNRPGTPATDFRYRRERGVRCTA